MEERLRSPLRHWLQEYIYNQFYKKKQKWILIPLKKAIPF